MAFVMRTLLALTLLGAVVLPGAGQGPVDPGPIVIEDLGLGAYWYGKKISTDDLKGKVVLVEIWGS